MPTAPRPSAPSRSAGGFVAAVEVSPRAAVFLRAVRGERDEASLELVGHESASFRIERVESASSRVTTRIEPIELGHRYRMHFTLQPGTPVGRAHEPIVVHTSSRSAPEVRIAAYTFVHERVYTFPDVVDLGAIRRSDLRREPALADRIAQTLMVYQRGGKQLEARFHSDLPQLGIRAGRSPNGDRWQALVRLEPTAVELGQISGSIVVETNDPISAPRRPSRRDNPRVTQRGKRAGTARPRGEAPPSCAPARDAI